MSLSSSDTGKSDTAVRIGLQKHKSIRNNTRKTGYLHKMSRTTGAFKFMLRNWKRRYFVFEDGVNLDYYVDETLAQSKGTYTINAKCVVKIVFEPGPTLFTFTIEDTKRNITHLLAADTEEDRTRWMAMITDAIHSLKAFSDGDAFDTADSQQSEPAPAVDASTDAEVVPSEQVETAESDDTDDDNEEEEEEQDSDDEDDSDNESGGEDGGAVVKAKLQKSSKKGANGVGGSNAAPAEPVGFNSAGIFTGGAWTRGPMVLRSGSGGGSGGAVSDAPKYASDTIAVLNAQLIADGKKPLEFLPLKTIKKELAHIFEQVNAGEEYDEGRMDHLLKCMEFNPEYKREKEADAERWRATTVEYSKECLEIMRGFVPTNVFSSSLAELQNQGLSKELAKRIYTKKCLWLVRMRTADLMKLHEADLLGKFGCEALQLDIVELCAIYAIAPIKFTVDTTGKKEIWRSSLEGQVRKMLAEKEADKLPKNKQRALCYKNQKPLFCDDDGWKIDDRVTGNAFGKQEDFRTLCQAAAELAAEGCNVDDGDSGGDVTGAVMGSSSTADIRRGSTPAVTTGGSSNDSAAERSPRPMSMPPRPTGGPAGLTLMQELALRKKVGPDPEDETASKIVDNSSPPESADALSSRRASRPNPFGGSGPPGMTLMEQIAARNKNKNEATEAAESSQSSVTVFGADSFATTTPVSDSVPSSTPAPASAPPRPQLSFMDQIKKRQQLE